MGIPVKIDELISPQILESTRIEYKRDFNPSPIIKTICAFANDIDNVGGGYIVIGVEEENGSPKFPIAGLQKESIDGMLKKLREYCHFIEPLYEPVVEPALYHDKTDGKEKYLIVIWVSGGYSRPYRAPKEVTANQSYKYYFVRKFSSSVIASREEEKELFYVSSNIPFDDRECLAASVDDLDANLMREHLKEIGSNLFNLSFQKNALEIARDMKLVSGPEENIKPLNVAILMFSEKIDEYFKYARIEIVDIPDPTGTNMTEKIFTGPIQRQLKDALAYLKNYVLEEAVIKEEDKAEASRIMNYPFAAVEEILANAVYHRSYQINEPITVRITPQSMEITSFPGFDRSITEEDIANYEIRARAYRNRRIGDFLKELRLIEGRNTGFPNAFNALRKNGSELPKFIMNQERDYLSVVIPAHPYFAPQDSLSPKQKAYEEEILSTLKEKPLTLTEIALALGYKGISKRLSETVKSMEKSQKLSIIADEQTHSVKYQQK